MRRASSLWALAAALSCAGAFAADEAELQRRGAAAFRSHCIQCHGENADGRGPLAPRFDPPPSNIAASTRTDEYRAQIITLGGASLGRSPVMPEWGLELSGQDILGLVAYLRKVSDEAAARAQAKGGKTSQLVRAGG